MLLPVVLRQDRGVAVLSREVVLVELALRHARLPALPLKETPSRTRDRARRHTRPMDRGAGEIPHGSVGGEYIKAGEPIVEESVG